MFQNKIHRMTIVSHRSREPPTFLILELVSLPYESDQSYVEADWQKDSFGLEVLDQSTNEEFSC